LIVQIVGVFYIYGMNVSIIELEKEINRLISDLYVVAEGK